MIYCLLSITKQSPINICGLRVAKLAIGKVFVSPLISAQGFWSTSSTSSLIYGLLVSTSSMCTVIAATISCRATVFTVARLSAKQGYYYNIPMELMCVAFSQLN